MDYYQSHNKFIARTPVSLTFSEQSGGAFTDEYLGPKDELERLAQQRGLCGYSNLDLEETSPGGGLWRLRLRYIGSPSRKDAIVRPEIEEMTSHWLIQTRYDSLKLWRHPAYEPLTQCIVELGKSVWRGATNADGDFELEFLGTSGDAPPRILRTNERFPYADIIRLAVNAWKSGKEGQLSRVFNNILLQIPNAENQIIISGEISTTMNLREEFDIRKHVVTELNVRDVDTQAPVFYSLLPLLSPKAPALDQNELIALAQDYADELLAGRDTAEQSRPLIVNNRVVGAESGIGTETPGVNMVWTSSQIQNAIRRQLEEREARRIGTLFACREPDATFQDIITRLSGARYKNQKWVRRETDIRQGGRGRLEIKDEWEGRFAWEINEKVFPDYEG